MIVNPAPGALVRDPATSLAIEPGADVDPNEPYFARALADGDLLAAAGDAPAPDQALALSERPHTDEDDA